MCSPPLTGILLRYPITRYISVGIRNVAQGAQAHKEMSFLLCIQLATLYCMEYTIIDQGIKKKVSFPPGCFMFPPSVVMSS